MEYLDQNGILTDDYYGYVYIILDQKHNLIYVGQRIGKVNSKKNLKYFGSGTRIKYIKNSRGIYFLKKTILGVCHDAIELEKCEYECKCFFDACNPLYGYNIIKHDTGGDTLSNHPDREEIGKKISKTKKEKGVHAGENNIMFGKHHSEKTCKQISEKLKGLPGTWIGRHHSEESKEKISMSLLGKHPVVSEEERKRRSIWMSEKNKSNKGCIPWNKGLIRKNDMWVKNEQ